MGNKIFVMIPAYRDPLLVKTLKTAIENADIPENITFAIGMQYEEDSPDISFIPKRQLKTISVHPDGRPGVYKLRKMLTDLYSNEDYYLSIDSHTYLESSWDTKLIETLESTATKTGNEKTILVSHQGPGWGTDSYTQLGFGIHGSNGSYKLRLTEESCLLLKKPLCASLPRTYYLPAGVFFTRGDFANEIRWGELWQNEQEEPFLSFEAFMLGWDIFVLIHENIIDHRPEEYYEIVYKEAPTSSNRIFNDGFAVQTDNLDELIPKIWETYLHNDNELMVKKSLRSVEQWWKAIGLYDQYSIHAKNEIEALPN